MSWYFSRAKAEKLNQEKVKISTQLYDDMIMEVMETKTFLQAVEMIKYFQN